MTQNRKEHSESLANSLVFYVRKVNFTDEEMVFKYILSILYVLDSELGIESIAENNIDESLPSAI